MRNNTRVRGINEGYKIQQKQIRFKRIGHSSKDNSKRILDMYKRFDKITHGKSERELLVQANSPKVFQYNEKDQK